MAVEHETHRLVVPRTARFLTAGPLEGQLEEVWVLCHGYGQLAVEILEGAAALLRPGGKRLLVAPEALSRFYHADHERIGASWMTREERLEEIRDYVMYLDLVHDRVFSIVERDAVKLVALGFSQGGATAARWALRGKGRVDRLVLWGAALPPEIDGDEELLSRLRATPLTLVGGSRDGYFTEEVREEERRRLGRGDVTFEELHFEGGHQLDEDTLRALTGELRV